MYIYIEKSNGSIESKIGTLSYHTPSSPLLLMLKLPLPPTSNCGSSGEVEARKVHVE